jgi:two-component system sensor histidine kinase TctE
MLRSLHARLLIWLVVPLLFLSIAHIASTYSDTRRTAESIFDKLLVMLALSISEHALASSGDILTDDLLEMIRKTTNDNLYYKVIGPDHSFIMGYEDIPEPPSGIKVLEQHLQFYDAIYFDQEVRIIAVSTLVDRFDINGWMTTFVAQTVNDREAYVSSILVDVLARVFLLIIIATVLLSIGISLALRPLKKLEKSVQRRDMHDLSPIRRDHMPQEIQGLVTALNDLLRRLGANLSLTRRFVENAAHQLRTPVTALLPQSALALRHAESDRERKAVGKIKQSAEKIARLTNQLLNLTYAESISLSAKDFSQVHLDRIVERHVANFLERHPDARIESNLGPAPVMGKELLLGEIVDNLLDNANKYSGSSAMVTVHTCKKGDESVLEVSDNGPGIAKEDHEKVFERFYRAVTDPPGSGLGLSIVKEIIEAHGGSISLQSGPDGTGTCVRCTFPATGKND